jgi:hypothetical protein
MIRLGVSLTVVPHFFHCESYSPRAQAAWLPPERSGHMGWAMSRTRSRSVYAVWA